MEDLRHEFLTTVTLASNTINKFFEIVGNEAYGDIVTLGSMIEWLQETHGLTGPSAMMLVTTVLAMRIITADPVETPELDEKTRDMWTQMKEFFNV